MQHGLWEGQKGERGPGDSYKRNHQQATHTDQEDHRIQETAICIMNMLTKPQLLDKQRYACVQA